MEKGEMKQQKLTEKGKKTEIAYKNGENHWLIDVEMV